jgi:hypothetical protein
VITWEQVAAWRTRRHRLGERAAGTPAEVAAGLAGLHAQLMSSAELAALARLDALAPEEVADALWRRRALVKTWAMRGTLHLLPAAEFGLWQAAQRTRRHYLKPSWYRGFGITPDELEALLGAVAVALDGRALTRAELADEVAARTGSAHLGDKLRDGFGPLLKPAAFRGLLCFGPNRGREVTFVRPDQWLADLAEPDPEAARGEVFARFLAASGPMTRDELARWWGGTPAEAGRVLRGLGERALQVDVEGTAAWVLATDVDALAAAEPVETVRLLPAFDQYVVTATRQAEHFLPGPYADRVYRPQGWLSPVLLVDGCMAGVWSHEAKGDRLIVTVEPFGTLSRRVEDALAVEAERLAAYLGRDLELVTTRG